MTSLEPAAIWNLRLFPKIHVPVTVEQSRTYPSKNGRDKLWRNTSSFFGFCWVSSTFYLLLNHMYHLSYQIRKRKFLLYCNASRIFENGERFYVPMKSLFSFFNVFDTIRHINDVSLYTSQTLFLISDSILHYPIMF